MIIDTLAIVIDAAPGTAPDPFVAWPRINPVSGSSAVRCGIGIKASQLVPLVVAAGNVDRRESAKNGRAALFGFAVRLAPDASREMPVQITDEAGCATSSRTRYRPRR